MMRAAKDGTVIGPCTLSFTFSTPCPSQDSAVTGLTDSSLTVGISSVVALGGLESGCLAGLMVSPGKPLASVIVVYTFSQGIPKQLTTCHKKKGKGRGVNMACQP